MWGISIMTLDIESKLYIEAKGLPANEILSISFLPVEKFYETAYKSEKYIIVADEDEGMNEIGINQYGNIYFLGFGSDSKQYISHSLSKFAKQLLSFQSFKRSVANCGEEELKRHTNEFKKTINDIDSTALKNDETFWSDIFKHMKEVLR